MLQENKARQIFRKRSISYPQEIFVVWKILLALFSCNNRFENLTFALLPFALGQLNSRVLRKKKLFLRHCEFVEKMVHSFTYLCRYSSWKFGDQRYFSVIALSANPTKWSNTLKQSVGISRGIDWVCLTILWGWRLKDYYQILHLVFNVAFIKMFIVFRIFLLLPPLNLLLLNRELF